MTKEEANKVIECLKNQGIGNICTSCKLDEDGNYIVSYIQFSYWINSLQLSFKLKLNPKSNLYSVSFKNTEIIKNIKLENLSKNLDRLDAEVHLGNNQTVVTATFKKKRSGKRK